MKTMALGTKHTLQQSSSVYILVKNDLRLKQMARLLLLPPLLLPTAAAAAAAPIAIAIAMAIDGQNKVYSLLVKAATSFQYPIPTNWVVLAGAKLAGRLAEGCRWPSCLVAWFRDQQALGF